MRCAAAEIEERAFSVARFDHVEHDAIALRGVGGVRPIDPAVRIAMTGEAILVMTDKGVVTRGHDNVAL